MKRADSEITDWLHDPGMLDNVVRDLTSLGYAGEGGVKKLLWLCGNSRILEDTLAVRVMSPAGSGKSKIVDTVKMLFPPDNVWSFTGLTEKALYHLAADPASLMHKLVVLAESQGAREADYELRILLSEKELILASVEGGKSCVRIVKGPIAYIETGTKDNVHVETASRMFIVTLDTGPQQTRLAQQAIASKYADPAPRRHSSIISRHRAIQEALAGKVRVIIPFAERIRFPDTGPLARREFAKFLALVATTASVFRYQRRRKGSLIVADTTDFEVALELAAPLVQRALRLKLPGKGEVVLDCARRISARKPVFGTADVALESGLSEREVRYAANALTERGVFRKVQGSQGKEVLLEYMAESDPMLIAVNQSQGGRSRRRGA